MCRYLTVYVLCGSVSALPLVAPSADSSLGLEFPLAFSPLVILLLLKMGFIGYRRHLSRTRQTVEGTRGSSLTLRIGSFDVYFKLVQTAYLVGFLGSPAWETRTRGNARYVSRSTALVRGIPYCAPSPILYSRMLSGSSHVVQGVAYRTQHSSRRTSLCEGTRRKSDSAASYHSYPTIGFSARTHSYLAPPLFFPAPVHFPSRSEDTPPQRPSPSLVQVMEPVFSATASLVPVAPPVGICSEMQLPAKPDGIEVAHWAYDQGILGGCILSASVLAANLQASASQLARSSVGTSTEAKHPGHGNATSVHTIFPTHQCSSIAIPPSIHHAASRPRSSIIVSEDRE